MGSIITDGKSRSYGASGSGKRGNSRKSFDRGGNYRNTTGTGSSSRRTSTGDVLSKRWENMMTRDPDSAEAHNIDAIRKHIILNKLDVTSQPRMNRLKQALTQPYGRSGEVSYQKAKSYDDVIDERWEKRHPIKRLNTKP